MLKWLYVIGALVYCFGTDVCIKRGDFKLAVLLAALAVINALIAWKIPDEWMS